MAGRLNHRLQLPPSRRACQRLGRRRDTHRCFAGTIRVPASQLVVPDAAHSCRQVGDDGRPLPAHTTTTMAARWGHALRDQTLQALCLLQTQQPRSSPLTAWRRRPPPHSPAAAQRPCTPGCAPPRSAAGAGQCGMQGQLVWRQWQFWGTALHGQEMAGERRCKSVGPALTTWKHLSRLSMVTRARPVSGVMVASCKTPEALTSRSRWECCAATCSAAAAMLASSFGSSCTTARREEPCCRCSSCSSRAAEGVRQVATTAWSGRCSS